MTGDVLEKPQIYNLYIHPCLCVSVWRTIDAVYKI